MEDDTGDEDRMPEQIGKIAWRVVEKLRWKERGGGRVTNPRRECPAGTEGSPGGDGRAVGIDR